MASGGQRRGRSRERGSWQQRRRQSSSSRGRRKGGGTHSQDRSNSNDSKRRAGGGGRVERGEGGWGTEQAFKAFIFAAAATAAAKSTSKIGQRGSDDAGGEKGKFDLYLLAQSWAPRFCCSAARKCTQEAITDVTDLTTHGLWPAYAEADAAGRTYPAFCEKRETNGQAGREQHEWLKHGTCTRLLRDDYFDNEAAVAEHPRQDGARELLAEAAGGSVRTAELVEKLGGTRKVAIMADKFCKLTEITTCYSVDAGGGAGAQIDCPEHLLGSSRNSAQLKGCAKLWVDEAGTCTMVKGALLEALKRGDRD